MTSLSDSFSAPRVPRILAAAAEAALAARGNRERLAAVLDRSPIPMITVDDQRLYVQVNPPAQLMARSSLAEMRRSTMDDLTAPSQLPELQALWARLMEDGSVVGRREVAALNGSRLHVVYWGLANALPGLHLFAFAPADWSGDTPGLESQSVTDRVVRLTPRELEVLQLAAEGQSGPSIAERLVVSPATVRTHFRNLYEKLSVSDRAAAVAKGMRLGLID